QAADALSARRGVRRPVRVAESGAAGLDRQSTEAEAGEDRKESGLGAARQTESVWPEEAPVCRELRMAAAALIPEWCWPAAGCLVRLNLVLSSLVVPSRASQKDAVARLSAGKAAWAAAAGQADAATWPVPWALATVVTAEQRDSKHPAVTLVAEGLQEAESGCRGPSVEAAAESRGDGCPLLLSLWQMPLALWQMPLGQTPAKWTPLGQTPVGRSLQVLFRTLALLRAEELKRPQLQGEEHWLPPTAASGHSTVARCCRLGTCRRLRFPRPSSPGALSLDPTPRPRNSGEACRPCHRQSSWSGSPFRRYRVRAACR
ncbi:MAG: hypothetical protein QOJ99_1003, partial [Bryobacterales bacterium]|nr:hypothetical protein [Bryobacterales bacterium]